jgi:protein-L-isoaspartate(D-aspartate) O-methyltransferase
MHRRAIDEHRANLVRDLKSAGRVRSAPVEAAFKTVPRHIFLPALPAAEAYRDCAHSIKSVDGIAVSSSSQPAMMAEMLEQLGAMPGERILEIGAGSGYNAALLAELVGPEGFVATVDIDDDIVRSARRNLDAAGFAAVVTLCDDGALGAPGYAPFDALIVTVAVGDVPPAWMRQVRIGGRIVVPLALGLAQRVIRFDRRADSLLGTSVIGGEFVAFRGSSSAASIGAVSILGDPGIRLRMLGNNQVDSSRVTRALHGQFVDTLVKPPLGPEELWGSLDLWLSVNEPGFCRLTAQGPAAESGRVPDAFGAGRAASHAIAATLGVCVGSDLAVFAATERGMSVRSYGGVSRSSERLGRAIANWDESGRPQNRDLEVTAMPRTPLAARTTLTVPGGALGAIVETPSMDLLLRWTR